MEYTIKVPPKIEKLLEKESIRRGVTKEQLISEALHFLYDWPVKYEYEVLPEHQDHALKCWAADQGHNKFKGFIVYAGYKLKKTDCKFFLTVGGISATPVDRAFNIKRKPFWE